LLCCVFSAAHIETMLSLGGVCKKIEMMHHYSSSVRGGEKQMNLNILIIHTIVSYDHNISFIFIFYRPETVHCITKNA